MNYSPELADLICERIANGESVREIGRSEGMPSDRTIFRWLVDHADFCQQYTRAKQVQADRMAEELLEIADDATNDWMKRQQGEDLIEVPNHEHINRSRLRVDARKWLMGKLAPKKYGDKLDVEHTIKRRADELTDDELAVIAATGGADADPAQVDPSLVH